MLEYLRGNRDTKGIEKELDFFGLRVHVPMSVSDVSLAQMLKERTDAQHIAFTQKHAEEIHVVLEVVMEELQRSISLMVCDGTLDRPTQCL